MVFRWKKDQKPKQNKLLKTPKTQQKTPTPRITLSILIFYRVGAAFSITSLQKSEEVQLHELHSALLYAAWDYTSGTMYNLIQNATVEPKVSKAWYSVRRSAPHEVPGIQNSFVHLLDTFMDLFIYFYT